MLTYTVRCKGRDGQRRRRRRRRRAVRGRMDEGGMMQSAALGGRGGRWTALKKTAK